MVVIDKDSNGNVQVTEEGVTETLFPNIDDIGGSGDGNMASGSFIPSSDTNKAIVNVNFEPQYAIIYADPNTFEKTSQWKRFLIFTDRAIPFTAGMLTRYNADAIGTSTAGLNEQRGSYSDGKYTFANVGPYNYIKGITYHWCCWG